MLLANTLLSCTLACLVAVCATAQTTVRLSSLPDFDVSDATAALKRALTDPNNDIVVIDDDGGSTITTGPVWCSRDDLEIRFEPGVTLRGKSGAFDTYQSLLSFEDCARVTIVGNGATIEMDKYEYDRSSQYRHCLALAGSSEVTVTDLTLTGAPGDGLFVGPNYVDGVPDNPCRDITVRNVTMDNNNRQGSSLTNVDGITFDNCAFTNTDGAAPQAGLSCEPFRVDQVLRNVLITNCHFEGNAGSGMEYVAYDQTAASPPVSIVIENSTFTGNSQATPGAAIRISNGNHAPGSITVRDTRIYDERRAGIIVRQFADGTAVTVDGVVVENVNAEPFNANAAAINVWPLTFGDPDEAPFGNVNFVATRVIDHPDQPHFGLENGGSNPPAENVNGDICVETDGELNLRVGSVPAGSDLEVIRCPSDPPPAPSPTATTTVHVRARSAPGGQGSAGAVQGMANDTYYPDGNTVIDQGAFETTVDWEMYTVELDGEFTADQIRVRYTNDRHDATVKRDLDIDYIEVDGVRYESESQDTYSTGTWTSYDGCAPGFKWSGRLHCGGYLHYATRGGNIGDTDGRNEGTSALNPGESADQTLTVSPNPARVGGQLNLSGFGEGGSQVRKASLFDAQGRLAATYSLDSDQAPRVSLAGLTAGVYTLSVTDGTRSARQLIVVQD